MDDSDFGEFPVPMLVNIEVSIRFAGEDSGSIEIVSVLSVKSNYEKRIICIERYYTSMVASHNSLLGKSSDGLCVRVYYTQGIIFFKPLYL